MMKSTVFGRGYSNIIIPSLPYKWLYCLN